MTRRSLIPALVVAGTWLALLWPSTQLYASEPDNTRKALTLLKRVSIPVANASTALGKPERVDLRPLGSVAAVAQLRWAAGERLVVTAYCGKRAPGAARAQGIHSHQWLDADTVVQVASKPKLSRFKQKLLGRQRTGRRFRLTGVQGHVVAAHSRGCTVVVAWNVIETTSGARAQALSTLVADIAMVGR